MKIVIDGLWHLGLVTAAGLLKLNNKVTCFSSKKKLVKNLKNLKLPIYEKGLEKILRYNLKNKKLIFTNDEKALRLTKVYWYCLDTPVNENDEGNTKFILDNIYSNLKKLKACEELIISSQINVGSIKKIEEKIKIMRLKIRVTYIPENLRLGKAIRRFLFPDRIIVGCRNIQSINIIKKIYGRIANKINFVNPESAEMIKHSINSFLANSICFINEISKISKIVGADSKEVSYGLKSDERIGFKSYLSPGSAYGGGTLGRDVMSLNKFSKDKKIKLPLLNNISLSNRENKNILINYFKKNKKKHKKILFLGLAYTEGTSTLRSSDVLKLANWMKKKKIQFFLHDPHVSNIPKFFKKNFTNNLDQIIDNIDTIIIMYNHTYYKKFQTIIERLSNIKKIFIYDPFMILNFYKKNKIEYILD
jgi:UDPglucose 6-dehydrogenase